jgi:hypothetical protein
MKRSLSSFLKVEEIFVIFVDSIPRKEEKAEKQAQEKSHLV